LLALRSAVVADIQHRAADEYAHAHPLASCRRVDRRLNTARYYSAGERQLHSLFRSQDLQKIEYPAPIASRKTLGFQRFDFRSVGGDPFRLFVMPPLTSHAALRNTPALASGLYLNRRFALLLPERSDSREVQPISGVSNWFLGGTGSGEHP